MIVQHDDTNVSLTTSGYAARRYRHVITPDSAEAKSMSISDLFEYTKKVLERRGKEPPEQKKLGALLDLPETAARNILWDVIILRHYSPPEVNSFIDKLVIEELESELRKVQERRTKRGRLHDTWLEATRCDDGGDRCTPLHKDLYINLARLRMYDYLTQWKYSHLLPPAKEVKSALGRAKKENWSADEKQKAFESFRVIMQAIIEQHQQSSSSSSQRAGIIL